MPRHLGRWLNVLKSRKRLQIVLAVSAKTSTFASGSRQTTPGTTSHMDTIKVEIKPKGLEMECDRHEFALALKTWRLRNAYTQRTVAGLFGVSRYTIMRAEAAQPITWEMAYRLFTRLSSELVKEAKS